MADESVTMVDTRSEAAIEVKAEDLPVHCPNPKMALWSSHPRVFLDIAPTGEVSCPYCGTRYRLAGGARKGGGH